MGVLVRKSDSFDTRKTKKEKNRFEIKKDGR